MCTHKSPCLETLESDGKQEEVEKISASLACFCTSTCSAIHKYNILFYQSIAAIMVSSEGFVVKDLNAAVN